MLGTASRSWGGPALLGGSEAEPVTLRMRCARLHRRGTVGLLPAVKATGASVQRGLQGSRRRWVDQVRRISSFIIGAQVACTLVFVPAVVGIVTNSLRQESTWAEFPTERYLTFVSARITKRWPASTVCLTRADRRASRAGIRSARGPVARGAWCDPRDAQRRLPTISPQSVRAGNGAGRCTAGSPAGRLRGRVRDGCCRRRLSRRVRRQNRDRPRTAGC